MGRVGLKLSRQQFQEGFTLIEAIIAMAIFSIGFSGLYFFYGMSTQAIAESEKRMYLNMMGARIIETVAAEGQRTISDPLNPFAYPSKYSGSLNSCNSYSTSDDRYIWCNDLNTAIGPYNPSSGLENRQVDVINDGTGLIINVSLIAAGGSISAFFTRKLRQL